MWPQSRLATEEVTSWKGVNTVPEHGEEKLQLEFTLVKVLSSLMPGRGRSFSCLNTLHLESTSTFTLTWNTNHITHSRRPTISASDPREGFVAFCDVGDTSGLYESRHQKQIHLLSQSPSGVYITGFKC